MNKDNILWKLDLLEAKHLHSVPRLPKTKILLNAKHKNKIPLLDLNRSDAIAKIEEFKSQLCERKVHSSLLKLNRCLKKIIALERNKLVVKLKLKSDDTKLQNELEAINGLDVELVSHAKLIKLILKVYKINVKDVEKVPKFLPTWCIETITNNEDKYNPKNQFKTNTQLQNNTVSKISNNKDFKSTVEEIESSLKLILGPVEKKSKLAIDDDDNSNNNSEIGESDDDLSENSEEESEFENDGEPEVGDEDIDLDAYKGMLAGSDDEDEEEESFKLDPNVDYTEITDEEPSEEEEEEEDNDDSDDDEDTKYEKLKLEKRKLENDDFFDFEASEQQQKKKTKKEDKKSKLPALQGGYFSGGESDSDIDNDKVVKSVTTQRKNRRGQRARQKIWELKYGSKAKHVEKEQVRVKSEREQKQKEYEERVKKREAKLRLLIEQNGSGSNQTPLSTQRTHKPSTGKHHPIVQEVLEKPLHPSWEAKLKAQELSKQKFAGKKIVFD